jgi:hypothetical protein
MSAKIINTLRDRLEIERQLQSLLKIEPEEKFLAQARRIAEGGAQVVAVVIDSLDRTHPRELSALGAIASFYPNREEILTKLYSAAADTERPDRERVSAMLILERFLEESVAPYLLQTLDDPRAVAFESIRELIAAGEHKPAVLLDYTKALSQHPDETVLDIIDTLVEVGEERAVPALCLWAQHEQEAVSTAALSALGQIRHVDAANGLQSLIPLLPPRRIPLAERSLRKLQFAGLPAAPQPTPDGTWRTLASPIDGDGRQVVWFASDPNQEGECQFLGLVLIEDTGIVQAYGNHTVPVQALPRAVRPGHIHRVPMKLLSLPGAEQADESAVLYMLETDLDYGRTRVRQAQSRNHELGQPLPPAYRLLGQLIWRYDADEIDAASQQPPELEHTWDLLTRTGSLPRHPLFLGWSVGSEQVEAVAHSPSDNGIDASDRETIMTWAAQIAQAHFDRTAVQRTRVRLLEMAEWLWRAEQISLAELTMAAAQTIEQVPPAQHPFTVSMAALGLERFLH